MAHIIFIFILLFPITGLASSLIERSNLTYIGAFALPTGTTFEGGGNGLAYHKTNNSLFLFGNNSEKKISEISIPELINTTDISKLERATIISGPIDIFNGNICNIGEDGTSKCGSTSVLPHGILVYPLENKLVLTSYMPYDALGNTVRSHFTANKDWSSEINSEGAFVLRDDDLEANHRTAGFVGGYMAWVPKEKQLLFGKSAITGQAALSIISRTSHGPSLFLFNPDDLGTDTLGSETNPLPVTPLVYYPSEHPTLGTYSSVLSTAPNPSFNMATQITSVVWPDGTDTVIFFGRTSTGSACYGYGTDNLAEEATHDEIVAWINTNGGQDYMCGTVPIGIAGNDYCCFDNVGSTIHGTHGYPYAYYAWAYNAADLLAVKNGDIAPWEVKPYAEWNFNPEFDRFIAPDGVKKIVGATYDPAKQIIYIAQGQVEGTLIIRPIIHAYYIEGVGTTNNPEHAPIIKIITEN